MSKSAKLIGEFKAVESVGSITEFLRKFDDSVEITEKISYNFTIPGSTTDQFIDFSEIATVRYLYMDADKPVIVKIGANTDTGFTINGPSIIAGPAGPIYVSTGADATVIDFSAFGV